jgi:hypothetical protein
VIPAGQHLSEGQEAISTGPQPIDYKTHILVVHAAGGKMAVIHHWPHVPRQDEVHQKIDAECSTYATFLLCTPTSVMPARSNGGASSMAL